MTNDHDTNVTAAGAGSTDRGSRPGAVTTGARSEDEVRRLLHRLESPQAETTHGYVLKHKSYGDEMEDDPADIARLEAWRECLRWVLGESERNWIDDAMSRAATRLVRDADGTVWSPFKGR